MCRVITDKHIIYSGYAGGKPQTASRQERRETTSQREKGKSTRREESKSVNHRGCGSSPDLLLVFPAQEMSSFQILQGELRSWECEAQAGASPESLHLCQTSLPRCMEKCVEIYQ